MATPALAPRLRRLPLVEVCGWRFPVAADARSRLLGLAWLTRDEAGAGLLISRCRSVHTFGMRFALDLVFLDLAGRPRSARPALAPRRFAVDPRADAVLELPAGSAFCGCVLGGEGGEFRALRP